MATLYDTSTGAATEVPDEQAHTAMLSGRYGLRGGEKVVLYDKAGSFRTVPTEQAPELIKAGYTWGSQAVAKEEMAEEKYGAAGAKALALLTGAGRGVSLGLSDRALRNLGVEANTLRTIEEASPATSMLGEVAGNVGGVLLTGSGAGIGKAAAGAAGLGKGLLGRAGAKAIELGAAGALEGGAFAAGKTVSEDALGRADLTAESLLANTGMGMLVGGGVGGLLGGGSVLAGAGVKKAASLTADKLSGGTIKEALENFADENTLGAALGQQRSAWKLLNKGAKEEGSKLAARGKRAAAYIREKVGLGAKNTEEIAEGLGKNTDELLKKQDDIIDGLDKATSGAAKAAGEAGESSSKAAARLQAAEKALAEATDAEAAAIKTARQYGDSVPGDVGAAAAKAKAGYKAALQEAKEAAAAAGASRGGLKRVSGEAVADRIEAAISELNPVTDRQIINTMKQAADGYRANNSGFMEFAAARAQRGAAQGRVNYKVPELADQSRAWDAIGRAWNDEIDAVAEPLLKEAGAEIAGAYRALRQEYNLSKELTDYANNRVLGNLSNAPVSLGDRIAGIGGLVASGEPAAGLLMGFANSQIRQRGHAVMATVALKLSRLKAIQKAANATSARIDDAIAGYIEQAFSGAARAVSPASARASAEVSFMPKMDAAADNRQDNAKARAKEIALLANDPQKMADKIAMSLVGVDEAAPNVSAQAAMVAAKTVSYLHAKAPKGRKSTATLQPLLDDWKPSKQEAMKFERTVRAATDPMSVLDDLRNGTLSPEAAEAFRTLYPKLHATTMERIVAKLAEQKKKLPYDERVRLSLLLGAPVDDSMRPERIASMHQMWEEKPQVAGGRKAASIGKLDIASNMRSATQKLEEKR